MNIFALGLLAVGFIATPAFACAEALEIAYPIGFVDFYSNFRSAIVSDEDGAAMRLACFPFQSTETGEAIETKTLNVSQKQFKHLKLEKYYLNDIAGQISSSISDGLPTRQIYMNAADFIKSNPNPGSPKNLNTNSRNLFVVKPHSVVISNLTFSERKKKWCWSGAETNEPISPKIQKP
jgi:hypothetical protein